MGRSECACMSSSGEAERRAFQRFTQPPYVAELCSWLNCRNVQVSAKDETPADDSRAQILSTGESVGRNVGLSRRNQAVVLRGSTWQRVAHEATPMDQAALVT
jgi:hypothetical protein